MADDEATFEAILDASSVYEAKVMTFILTEDVRYTMCAEWCTTCDKELVDGQLIYCWGEPFGNDLTAKHVAVGTHCSEACVTTYVHGWLDRIRPDRQTLDLYITYYAMNWHYEED